MNSQSLCPIYWDTSAILATLFRDDHTETAYPLIRNQGIHLISSLAVAETLAVIARLERDRSNSAICIETARVAFLQGPWRCISHIPRVEILQEFSSKWPLRGADLWHLGCAKTLAFDIPELQFLTFDATLKMAAQGEGMCT